MIKMFIHNIRCELKWMFQEIGILCKHPSRKASRSDIAYHWSKLWDHIIFHPWYCLKRGIRNLYVWFPLIWKNDCWDHFFLEDMMDKQMKEMEDIWEKSYAPRDRKHMDTMDKGYRCQHIRIWKRIRWTRKLMAMYRDEHYAMKSFKEHMAKFPERYEGGLFGRSKVSTVDEFGIPLTYECEPMTNEESTSYRASSEIARQKDEKVFKLFIKNFSTLRNWWD